MDIVLNLFLTGCVIFGLVIFLFGLSNWKKDIIWKVACIAGLMILVIIYLLTPFG